MPRKYRRKYRRRPTMQKTVKKIVKRELDRNIEDKHHLTTLAKTRVSYVPDFRDLTNPGQGLIDGDRIGDVIKCKYIDMNVLIEAPGDAGGDWVRFIVFKWLQNSDTSPTVNDILSGSSSNDRQVEAISTTNKPATFQILFDRMLYVQQGASNDGAIIRKRIKVNRNIYFNSAGTYGKNHIFAMVLTSSDSGTTTDHPYVSYQTVMVYEDA